MSRSDNEQRVTDLFSREQAVVFAKQFVDDPVYVVRTLWTSSGLT